MSAACRASPGNRGLRLSLIHISSTTFTVFADDNTDWRVTKLFDTDAEARKWIDEKLAIQSVQEPPAGS